mmetsp:Transcript_19716/g.28773  ORF Transcript_19716/g.28773 Transcript_19716/m.28773 type:complete len:355 (+) Transcript_19716:150-1214(+)|eukprot:CAMPEP_0197244928 /NCGR_PEP_ID=MMETSP1429-20130617/9882_1 /TAXON_ID=49237 /ORGANISM="Chaetoceros  sp., Strain UNC1202" /LENGTH=354 /DNA_ID=CAMNT_0042705353 /DNA_START=117 /DNA_END=1181 /DNA_ORIENTATION=+
MVETRSQKKSKEAVDGSTSDAGHPPQKAVEETSPSTNNNAAAATTEKPTIHTANTASPAAEEVAKTPMLTIVSMVAILAISYFTYPGSLQPVGRPTLNHVWYFGWISALSTGLGVLPLMFSPSLDSWWIGVTNAVAAGMMMAASYSLIVEGCMFEEEDDTSNISSMVRTIIGSILGLLFILSTKSFLDKHEDLKVGSLAGADARKVLLIIFVMTLHSFSEGIGIGVSFGGSNGHELGVFISASLAVHNVPEGLAVAIVLLPRKISKLTAALWCIVTSLPQPLMAVPAFLFVHAFIPFLPVGLGFAGGAMAWVALFELLMEAIEDTDILTTGICSTLSLCAMLAMQNFIDESSRN